jgi:hypothetical protein
MGERQKEEQLRLLRYSLRELGRVLKHQPEFEKPDDVPDRMRDIVARLAKERKPKNE